jgi:hypothetical protein
MNGEYEKRSRMGKVLTIVFIMAVAIFLCTTIENNKKKSNDEKNSYGVVKNAQVTDVREPRLYMYNKILVSESGATSDFFTEFRDVKISFSYDHKRAAVTADDELFYVDGQLIPLSLCNMVKDYGQISKDGGYILYWNVSWNSVIVYDINRNEDIKVAHGMNQESQYAISSNGKYVTLFCDNKTRIIPCGQRAVTTPVSDDKLIPIAVSDDGERAFYYDIDKRQDKTWVYSYHDKQLHEISELEGAYTWEFIVNKDCTDIFINGKVLWYYSNRNNKLRRVIGNNVKKFYFSEELSQIFEGYSRVQIVDVPTLEGCLVDSYRGNYWFYDVRKDAIKFPENEDFECIRIIDKELQYLFIRDGYVYKGNITTNRKTEEKFVELEYQARNVAANKDFSVIWFIDTDNCLHKYQNGHMYDFGDTGHDDAILKYVSCEKKLYYIKNGSVLAFDELTDEKTIVAERCRTRNDLSSDYGDFVGYTDFSGRKVIVIFGNIILGDE